MNSSMCELEDLTPLERLRLEWPEKVECAKRYRAEVGDPVEILRALFAGIEVTDDEYEEPYR